ncbi:hypothetical protein JW962_02470 [Candidatus Dojkabacteria bacterium]|nr:hypothetical protein [Candidatus Dojkabacteria bacterium]
MSDSNYVVVNAIDLRQNMGDLVNRVFYQGLTVFVKRRGKVVAKLIASDKSEVPDSEKVDVPRPDNVRVIEDSPVSESKDIPQATVASDAVTESGVTNIDSNTPEKTDNPTPPQNSTSGDSSISNDSLQQLKEELKRAGYDPSYIRQ